MAFVDPSASRGDTSMRIATFNVNGVNGRLPRLLEWLDEATPDVVCLQEIKTGDATFPAKALDAAGYCAVWHGQRSHHGVAILARGENLVETRRGLPGDEGDSQARYIEAKFRGLTVASIYLPNGNPQPGPKFESVFSARAGSTQLGVFIQTCASTLSGSTQTRFAATRASEWTSCF